MYTDARFQIAIRELLETTEAALKAGEQMISDKSPGAQQEFLQKSNLAQQSLDEIKWWGCR